MDHNQIEDEHIVARYLADQLTPAEADAFESYYTRHPSMVREIEYALRLKEGLATLRDHQQLDGLMRASSRRWAVPLSIAAATAIAIVGAWTWHGSAQKVPVASSVEGLLPGASSPLPLAGKYLLVRVRGADGTLQIPLPPERSAVELQMLPTAGASGAPYRVDLLQLEDSKNLRRIGELEKLSPGPDGLVTAVLDSAHLRAGRYALELTSMRPDGAMPPDRFVIELR
jgi:hypothetical protein